MSARSDLVQRPIEVRRHEVEEHGVRTTAFRQHGPAVPQYSSPVQDSVAWSLAKFDGPATGFYQQRPRALGQRLGIEGQEHRRAELALGSIGMWRQASSWLVT